MNLPHTWGTGPWLLVALEHVWESSFAPGQWALDQQFRADVWYKLFLG
jgi:hypothetical protein